MPTTAGPATRCGRHTGRYSRCVAVPNPHADRARFTDAALVLSSAADLSLDALLATLA
jgi:hypothetical protein